MAELFELTGMSQKIEESITNLPALQLAQNPELVKHKTEVRDFLERHIGWENLKDALTAMYLKEFSGKEINDMHAFYSSADTGSKVIERTDFFTTEPQRAQRMKLITAPAAQLSMQGFTLCPLWLCG